MYIKQSFVNMFLTLFCSNGSKKVSCHGGYLIDYLYISDLVLKLYVFCMFLAHMAKGHVCFCHHLVSVHPSYVVNFHI
jgi:hypothetical protein